LWEVPYHNVDVDTLHLLELELVLVAELVVPLQGICDVDTPMVVISPHMLLHPVALR